MIQLCDEHERTTASGSVTPTEIPPATCAGRWVHNGDLKCLRSCDACRVGYRHREGIRCSRRRCSTDDTGWRIETHPRWKRPRCDGERVSRCPTLHSYRFGICYAHHTTSDDASHRNKYERDRRRCDTCSGSESHIKLRETESSSLPGPVHAQATPV